MRSLVWDLMSRLDIEIWMFAGERAGETRSEASLRDSATIIYT
jgi:hypothetical protein